MRGTSHNFFNVKAAPFSPARTNLLGMFLRESTGTADQDRAEKFLKRRLREVGADVIGAKQFVGPQSDRINISCGLIAEEQRENAARRDCLSCAPSEISLQGRRVHRPFLT